MQKLKYGTSRVRTSQPASHHSTIQNRNKKSFMLLLLPNVLSFFIQHAPPSTACRNLLSFCDATLLLVFLGVRFDLRCAVLGGAAAAALSSSTTLV